jgi:SAM-dependent methyltransferase
LPFSAAIASLVLVAVAAGAQRTATRRIAWDDLAPLHGYLQTRGLAAATFASFVDRTRAANERRVREGDLDHLVFYLLQSTRFTTLKPIEPALSAKALVESLDAAEREAFLKTSTVPSARVSAEVRARMAALVRAMAAPAADPRQAYFWELVKATFPAPGPRESGLVREYLRAMRFVYEKEFVAQRSERPAETVAELYRTRGLSTDTAVEAGFLVHQGLGVMRALEPDRRVRRVLIVGPGLDLAPRTALHEEGPPESYQPWAIVDALLSMGLARPGELEVVAADINPRVVAHINRARAEPPTLRLVSEIRETDTVTLTKEYRDYFAELGRAIGEAAADTNAGNGSLRKTVRVGKPTAQAVRAVSLDIVTEHLVEPPFDLVVATNILPYFSDTELMLALGNVSRMLAPGGIFLHNEGRPLMQEVTSALGVPFQQSRHAVIANVRGAKAPLFDSVWLHRKRPRA